MALTLATQDALFWSYLFLELSLRSEDSPPIFIYCDSSAAVIMSHHDTQHGKSKHIAPKFFMVRDHVLLNDIDVIHVAGTLNTSDLMTKQLPNPAFSDHSGTALGEKEHDPPSSHSRF
jgi:hypothetical protein